MTKKDSDVEGGYTRTAVVPVNLGENGQEIQKNPLQECHVPVSDRGPTILSQEEEVGAKVEPHHPSHSEEITIVRGPVASGQCRSSLHHLPYFSLEFSRYSLRP